MQSVVAKTQTNVIGNRGKLPWHIPEDLKHFKQLTLGHSVLMGRKTWDEIYARLGKGLPQRRNIVLTSRPLPEDAERGTIVVRSVEEGIAEAGANGFVIGGARLYEATLGQITTHHITEVLGDYEGDTYFPQLVDEEWMRTVEKETPTYRFITLRRKG